MRVLLLLALLAPAARAADVPFYLREIEGPRDVSAINENFRSLVTDMTKLRADADSLANAPVATSTPTVTSSATIASQGITSTVYVFVTGSSATIRPVNQAVEVIFGCPALITGLNQKMRFLLKINGEDAPGNSAAGRSWGNFNSKQANYSDQITIPWLSTGTYNGSLIFSVNAKVDGATGTLDPGDDSSCALYLKTL